MTKHRRGRRSGVVSLRQRITGEKVSTVTLYDHDIQTTFSFSGPAGSLTPDLRLSRVFRPITSWMLTRNDLIQLMYSQLSGGLLLGGTDMWQNKAMHIRSWNTAYSFTNVANTPARVRIYVCRLRRTTQQSLTTNSYSYTDGVSGFEWAFASGSLNDSSSDPSLKDWNLWNTPVNEQSADNDISFTRYARNLTMYGRPEGVDMVPSNQFELASLDALAIDKMDIRSVFPDLTKQVAVTKRLDKVLRPGKTGTFTLRNRVPRDLHPNELLATRQDTGAALRNQKFGQGGPYTYFLFMQAHSLGSIKAASTAAGDLSLMLCVSKRTHPPVAIECRSKEVIRVMHDDGRKANHVIAARMDSVDSPAYDLGSGLSPWFKGNPNAPTGFNGSQSDFATTKLRLNDTSLDPQFAVHPYSVSSKVDTVLGRQQRYLNTPSFGLIQSQPMIPTWQTHS